MANRRLSILAACLAALATRSPARADGPEPACQRGYILAGMPCCEAAACKTSRVVPDVKKVRHPEYRMKVEHLCHLKCKGLFGCFKKKCGQECPPACGKPRTKRVLIKRIVEEEDHGWKCVVEDVPCAEEPETPCLEKLPAPRPDSR